MSPRLPVIDLEISLFVKDRTLVDDSLFLKWLFNFNISLSFTILTFIDTSLSKYSSFDTNSNANMNLLRRSSWICQEVLASLRVFPVNSWEVLGISILWVFGPGGIKGVFLEGSFHCQESAEIGGPLGVTFEVIDSNFTSVSWDGKGKFVTVRHHCKPLI